MSSSLHVRDARKDELPVLTHIAVRAFRGRPMSEALFPEHLRLNPGDADKIAFRQRSHLRRFDQDNQHYIVVVDDTDTVVGFALWVSAQDPAKRAERTPEELQARNASFPKSLDLSALEAIEAATEVLDKYLRDALGEDEYNNSWCLDIIAVDPNHQRKGIGKMLMEWGEERAAKQHKNIRFMASTAGAKMYRALGYEEVGALDILGGMEHSFIKKRA